MKRVALFTAILFATSASVSAAEPAKNAETKAVKETKQKKKKKEKKICRSEKVTGSLTRVNRTCLTKAEWDAIEAKTRENVGDIQRNAAGGANSAWDPSTP